MYTSNKALRNRMKNTFPLYISKDFMIYSDDSEDDEEGYGYFCDESEEYNTTTIVEWNQYNEYTHLHSLTQRHNNLYNETSDSEVSYENDTTTMDNESNECLRQSIYNMYLSTLKIFYYMVSYVTVILYKIKP